MKRVLTVLSIVLVYTIITTTGHANSPEITDSLNYLKSTQNTDGSWGEEDSIAYILPSTVTVMEILEITGESEGSNYMDAVVWLQDQELMSTNYLAERIRLLSQGGEDLELLLSYMDETFLWGGFEEHDINILDTVLSVQALKAINYEDTETIGKALDYLTTTQNTDFGWGFEEGDESSVFMTATVLKTLLLFRDTYNFESEITTAASCLLSTHTPEGGFGTTPEETALYETALATEILIDTAAQAEEVLTAITYLQSTQQPDGSRESAPYSTSLALRVMTKTIPDPM